MPPTQCVACNDSAIDAATRDPARSGRTIARDFGISEAAVRRHRTNHLTARAAVARAGRPTNFTEARVEQFLVAIRAGATLKSSALSVGWSEDALAQYRRNSSDFADQLAQAEGEAQVHLVHIVRTAAQTNWRAALELLGRRWPESWGRHDRLDQPDLAAQAMVVTVEFDKPEAFGHPERPLILDTGGR